MNSIQGSLKIEELQFFGKVSASVSHDFKNALAIINENAGLLQDIVFMAEKGVPLNPERIKSVAGKVRERVSMADNMVKFFNKFTHSPDNPVCEIDLGEYIEVLIELSRRSASKHGINILFDKPQVQTILTTSPFFLINLCWQCLEAAMASAGDSKEISVKIEETEKGIKVCYINSSDKFHIPDTFTEQEASLFDVLGAVFFKEDEDRKITLLFPGNINK